MVNKENVEENILCSLLDFLIFLQTKQGKGSCFNFPFLPFLFLMFQTISELKSSKMKCIFLLALLDKRNLAES